VKHAYTIALDYPVRRIVVSDHVKHAYWKPQLLYMLNKRDATSIYHVDYIIPYARLMCVVVESHFALLVTRTHVTNLKELHGF
jgi:hypothetical protein